MIAAHVDDSISLHHHAAAAVAAMSTVHLPSSGEKITWRIYNETVGS